MDWVHCNSCFSIPDSEKSFYLTSCGHIYCRDCEAQCARGQCKLCGNECTSIILSSTMKPDVQMYFTDPDELLKKKLKEVHQVSEFQKNHRARLVLHQRKQLKKFKSVKEDFRKLLKNLKDIDGEKKRLTQENEMLKNFMSLHRNLQTSGSSNRSEKVHYEKSPPNSNVNSVLSKFMDRMDETRSQHSHKSDRITVISPPMNGKMGIIPHTPSPSTALRQMNLSSHSHSSDYHKSEEFVTPNSTPGSCFSNFITPGSGLSPLDPYTPTPQIDPRHKGLHYKKDVRKIVVHPYSPNE